MRRLGCICAVMLGLVLGACGDSAADQCKAYYEAMCSKVSECGGGDKAQCLSASEGACDDVSEVHGDADACIDGVESMSCEDFTTGNLPSACSAD